VALQSWQGTIRAGLLSLVSSTTPAAGPQAPEVLLFDRVRLHDLQNALQQLMVAAAGLLMVQQLRQAASLPWDAELRAQARRRLLVVLADPAMKLAHLVTELTQLAGAGAVATEERVSASWLRSCSVAAWLQVSLVAQPACTTMLWQGMYASALFLAPEFPCLTLCVALSYCLCCRCATCSPPL
jgi:hypothetical protein